MDGMVMPTTPKAVKGNFLIKARASYRHIQSATLSKGQGERQGSKLSVEEAGRAGIAAESNNAEDFARKLEEYNRLQQKTMLENMDQQRAEALANLDFYEISIHKSRRPLVTIISSLIWTVSLLVWGRVRDVFFDNILEARERDPVPLIRTENLSCWLIVVYSLLMSIANDTTDAFIFREDWWMILAPVISFSGALLHYSYGSRYGSGLSQFRKLLKRPLRVLASLTFTTVVLRLAVRLFTSNLLIDILRAYIILGVASNLSWITKTLGYRMAMLQP